jgi:predicted AAA+ superfamily ATPase
MRTIERVRMVEHVQRALRRSPVVLLLGPRQCGKTTLARGIASGTRSVYFDLEDPDVPLRGDVAKQVLAPLRGLIVIDEFQRQPALFELIRVLADRRPLPARFLILGSASPELVRGASETLAGRVAHCELGGLESFDVGAVHQSRLWLRGGFPRSFLARSDGESAAWRADFITTFLERDVPQLGLRVPAAALRRFWTMLAHYHGQIWNAAELARSLGTGEAAVRHHLDILSGTYLVRQLPPWFENVGKRLVKSPRVFVRDSGILHQLLGVRSRLDLHAHPKLGASWEGFAVEQIIRRFDADRDAYFYRTHAGAELDLLLVRGGRRIGFEMKYADAPQITKSMHIALEDLQLDRLFVVHPGERTHPLHDRIEALALADLDRAGRALGRH